MCRIADADEARPSSCAEVNRSAMAPPCQKTPVSGNFHPGQEPSGQSWVIPMNREREGSWDPTGHF